MNLTTILKRFTLGLGTSERSAIWRAIGSFKANQIATDPNGMLQEGYESCIEVYSVIKKITDIASVVPLIIEEEESPEVWVESKKATELHTLLANPNDSKGYTFQQIHEQLLIYLLSTGNSLLYGIKPVGMNSIAELDVLPSNHINVKSNNDFFSPEVQYQMNLSGESTVIPGDEVGHIMFFNPAYQSVTESFWGLSPIQVASQAVKVSNDRWDADANLLQNRGAIGMISDASDEPMLDSEAEKVQASFDAMTAGTHNFGRVKVTNKNLKYIQMAMSSVDLQLIEKGVTNLRAICNVYGLKSELFNDPASKTFNSTKEAEKSLYTGAIMPINNKIEQELNRWLVPNVAGSENLRVRFDYSAIESLQSDKKIEAEKDNLVMIGLNTVLNMPVTPDAKAKLLVENYDFTETAALEIVALPIAEGGSVDDFADVPEAASANAEAQARLRGSVGGVQGILAIQQGIAAGTSSESSAISTMIEIYGFDEATARRVLGL